MYIVCAYTTCTVKEKCKDKKMIINYLGQRAEIKKQDFYCKAGAYEHKSRIGWVLVVNDKIVAGDRKIPTNFCDGASRYDWPEYKTRKALLEDIAGENEEFEHTGTAGVRG